MIPAISYAPNNVVYQGALTNAESTFEHVRTYEMTAKAYNAVLFKIDSPVVFIDVKESITDVTEVGKSTYNELQAKLSMNILAELLQTGDYRTSSGLLAPHPGFVPEKIACLTPYEAQFRIACST
jgi:superfamily I DNA and/or RNA helicase